MRSPRDHIDHVWIPSRAESDLYQNGISVSEWCLGADMFWSAQKAE